MNPYPSADRPPFNEGGSLPPSVREVTNTTGRAIPLVEVPSHLDPEWRVRHPVEALTCDLLVELGYEPRTIAVENQIEQPDDAGHVLDIDENGVVDLKVFELDDAGRKYLVWNDEAKCKEAAHHVDTVTIDPERVARYRADLEAIS